MNNDHVALINETSPDNIQALQWLRNTWLR